jgi:hypothetical protein
MPKTRYLYEFGSMPDEIERSVSNLYLHTLVTKGQTLPDTNDPVEVQAFAEMVVVQTGLTQGEVKEFLPRIIWLMDSWNLIAEGPNQ